jgi:hypothetical protein
MAGDGSASPGFGSVEQEAGMSGSGVARKLDFGDVPTAVTGTGRGRAGLRRAAAADDTAGAGKYRVLAHRRRLAQMRARHVLDAAERGVGGAAAGLAGGGRLVGEVR